MRLWQALVAVLLGAALGGAGMGWHWRLPSGAPPPVLPAGMGMSAAKVELGRRLFYDADLSADGTLSCATCHEQRHGFADSNAMRPGVHGDPGRRNAPGLANAAWRTSLTWGDPRITTLEAQALIPLLGNAPVEMGMRGRESELARRLAGDPCYRRMFARAFPERDGAIDTETMSRAIAAFERTLIALDTPFDRYRLGHARLPAAALRGKALFDEHCAGCHSGRDLTDDDFHALEPSSRSDRGLGEVTGKQTDDGRFRTPGLRNVTLTAPYFQDGSARDLGSAISRHQSVAPAVAHWTTAETGGIEAFLDTLTDQDFIADRAHSMPGRACGKRL